MRMRGVLWPMRGRLLRTGGLDEGLMRTGNLDEGLLPFDAYVRHIFSAIGPEVTLEYKCDIRLLKGAYPALS